MPHEVADLSSHPTAQRAVRIVIAATQKFPIDPELPVFQQD
jgi:hypothetical protein